MKTVKPPAIADLRAWGQVHFLQKGGCVSQPDPAFTNLAVARMSAPNGWRGRTPVR